MQTNFENLAALLQAEMARAEQLHPGEFDYQTWLYVLAEEVGELARELLEKKPLAYQVEEATHVATVAVRIFQDRGGVNVIDDVLDSVFSGKKPSKGTADASFRQVLFYTGQLTNYSTWAAADTNLRKVIFHAVTLLARLLPEDGSVPEVDLKTKVVLGDTPFDPAPLEAEIERLKAINQDLTERDGNRNLSLACTLTKSLKEPERHGEELIEHLDIVTKLRNKIEELKAQLAASKLAEKAWQEVGGDQIQPVPKVVNMATALVHYGPLWFVTVNGYSPGNKLQEVVSPLVELFHNQLWSSVEDVAERLTAVINECNARYPRCTPLAVKLEKVEKDPKAARRLVIKTNKPKTDINTYDSSLAELTFTPVRTHPVPTAGLDSFIGAFMETGIYVRRETEFTKVAEALGFVIKPEQKTDYRVLMHKALSLPESSRVDELVAELEAEAAAEGGVAA